MAGRRRPRRATAGASIRRWAVVLTGGTAATWLVISSGIARAVGDQRPAVALRVAPYDARANARLADVLLLKPNARPDERAAARTFAEAALARDPTIAAAYRTLALVGPGGKDIRPDERLLKTAESLSRREVTTQLALLEAQVQRGNVAGALGHYDTVLSTSPRHDPLLMPILVGAASDPNVRAPLADLLRHAPLWRRRFYTVMANLSVPPPVYAKLVLAMRRRGPLEDTDVFGGVAASYAQAEQAAPAWAIFRAVQPQWTTPPLVRNGSFARPNTQAPFDWQLFDGDSMAVQQGRVGNRSRLEMTSTRGDSGRIARQLIALPSGRYRLTLTVGPMTETRAPRLYRQVTCIDPSSARRVAFGEVDAARPTRVGITLAIPATGCRYQWLEIGARPATTDTATGAWLSDVALDRLTG